MSVQKRDSWDIQPPCERHPTTNEVSLSAWALEYDVIPALIPFNLRSYDPVAIVKSIREAFADALPTKASFTTAGIRRAAGINPNDVGSYQRPLIRLAGSWELSDGSHYAGEGSGARWVNPNYIHVAALKPSIKEPRYRIEELRYAASIGILSMADVAPRFGAETRNSVYHFCRRRDIPWKQWRQWGKRRISRTARLIYEWEDYSIRSIAETLGLPRTTLKDWMSRYHAADWEVPPDPSGEPWFGLHGNRNRGDGS